MHTLHFVLTSERTDQLQSQFVRNNQPTTRWKRMLQPLANHQPAPNIQLHRALTVNHPTKNAQTTKFRPLNCNGGSKNGKKENWDQLNQTIMTSNPKQAN